MASMEYEIQQLHAQLEVKERSFRRTSTAYKTLEKQSTLTRMASETQINAHGQSLEKMRQELQDKAQQLEDLTLTNNQLSQQCDSLCEQLDQALEINENSKKEKTAWEMALKQASNDQKK